MNGAVDRLARLGVPPRLASVYVHLATEGPQTADALAVGLDISRPEAYRRLDDAVQARLVRRVLDRPAKFHAEPWSAILDGLRQELDERARRLEAAQEAPELLQEPAEPEPPRSATFDILRGRTTGHRLIERGIAEATQEVCILNTHPGAVPWARSEALWDALRTRNDLEGRILLRDTPAVRAAVADSPPLANARIRFWDTGKLVRSYVFDSQQLIAWAVHDPSPRRTAVGDQVVRTDAPGLVEAHLELFDRLWLTARPATASRHAASRQ